MNIDEAAAEGAKVLTDAGVADARREAASLLAFVLDRGRTFLIAHPEYQLADDEAVRYRRLLERRARREPLQYITGRQEFWGLEFRVTPDVLIPRPETEVLVEEAVRLLRLNESPRFCEAAVGSGCIAVSILHSVPDATSVATDISPAAIDVASTNASRHHVGDRLELVETDLLAGITGPFDLIVSNPPYIPDADIDELQPEVRDHEPRLALAGGADGLAIIDRLIKASSHLVRTGGSLLIEIGFDQAERVRQLFDPQTWHGVEFLPDLQGIPRVAKATRK